MTVTLAFSPVEEARLRAKAEASGVSVETLVHDAALDVLSQPEVKPFNPQDEDEFERKLSEIAKLIPPHPPIPDEALRRENLYSDDE